MALYDKPKEIKKYQDRLHKIVSEVSEMRRLQSQFFKYRSTDTLKWAKKKEKEVDVLLKEYREPRIFSI